jgi:hypothetical protein
LGCPNPVYHLLINANNARNFSAWNTIEPRLTSLNIRLREPSRSVKFPELNAYAAADKVRISIPNWREEAVRNCSSSRRAFRNCTGRGDPICRLKAH